MAANQPDMPGEIEARTHLMKMVPRLGDAPHVLLGVPATASSDELRQAFLRLTKLYHPARFARFSPEIVKAANEVFLTIKKAYDTLSHGAPSRGTSTHTGRPAARAATAIGAAPPPAKTPAGTTPPARPSSPPAAARPPSTPPATQTPVPTRPSSPPARASTTPGTAAPPTPPRKPAPKDEPATQPTRPIAKPTAPPPTLGAAKPATPTDKDWDAAQELLRRKLWGDARQAFHKLAVAAPADKRYRAHMHYARGREAQDAGRPDEARSELQRALALDPDLFAARRALDDLPPEPDKGGLFSKLFKR